jgi:homoserine dehydrogenase
VPIILLGLGNVGQALLRQILGSAESLPRQAGLRLVPIALADSGGVLFAPDGLPEEPLCAALRAKADQRGLSGLPGSRPLDRLDRALIRGAILVDATASTRTEPFLRAALEAGCGVVLANKHPLSGPWEKARGFLLHPQLRYEATAGAGLPVIATLRYLIATGDRVAAIEGCFSGTLGFLCAELERDQPYATAVAQARELGYTEPDPREDLSGRDVARKALILSRTVRACSSDATGWAIDLAAIAVEPLYPDTLADVSVDAFLASASALNESYAARFAAARAGGQTLRYVARIGPEGSSVGLVTVPQDSSLGALRGPANYVAFRTERYHDVPLVISGPGAGPEVTAAGVFGDIVDLARGAGRALDSWV